MQFGTSIKEVAHIQIREITHAQNRPRIDDTKSIISLRETDLDTTSRTRLKRVLTHKTRQKRVLPVCMM